LEIKIPHIFGMILDAVSAAYPDAYTYTY